MKWNMASLLLPILLAALILPAHGATVEEILQKQEQVLDIGGLEQAAEEAGSNIEYGMSLDEGLSALVETGAAAAGGIVRTAVRSGVLLMVVVLLCGLAETMYDTLTKGKLSVVPLVGTAAIAAIAVVDMNSMLGVGRSAIDGMASFANVLLPTGAAITAATGAVTGAAALQMAAVLFSDLMVNLIQNLIIPLLYAYLAVSVAQSALGHEGVKQIASLLKWAATTLLKTVMLVFVGYLSLSGVVSGSVDAATIKAAKFAISGAIPVIGGILSDAAETILASAGVLKGTVGVFGAITILGICLLPVLRLAVHYLMYKLVAALSATVGSGRIGALVDQIGGAFGLMLGMTGACCLLLLIALVSSVMAVSV